MLTYAGHFAKVDYCLVVAAIGMKSSHKSVELGPYSSR